MKVMFGVMCLMVFATSPAFAATGYVCESAETAPALAFTVVVQPEVAPGGSSNQPVSADITVSFLQANPSVTVYKAVPYAAEDSGADHVAFEGEGISVIAYPDPQVLSTIVLGDAGGTQAGLAMHCQRR